MANKIQDKVTQLEEKRAKINAELHKVKARQRKEERKKETRRKILIGSAILNKIKNGNWPEEKMISMMDEFLDKPNDRELFNLKSNR